MQAIHVGTGGWSDNDPPYNRLRRYANVFDFVEVNNTFYNIPSIRTVRAWRRVTPESFIFAVKCSKIVTHEEGLQPTERSFESLERIVDVCTTLKSRILILQTPKSLEFDDRCIEGFRELLSSTSLEGLVLGLDPGGRYLVKVPEKLISIMRDYGVVHVTDLLKEEPAYEHEILYSRLFGVSVGDDELAVLLKRVELSESKHSYLSFHYLKMVDPALRVLRMKASSSDFGFQKP